MTDVETLADMANDVNRLGQELAATFPRYATDIKVSLQEATGALMHAASLRVQTDAGLDRRLRELEEWRASVQQPRASEDVVFWRTRVLEAEQQNAALRNEAAEREADLRRLVDAHTEREAALTARIERLHAILDTMQG